MKLRYLAALAVGGTLFFWAANASAVTRIPTKITLDSSVAVGNGYFVDSGRVITHNFQCELRFVNLVGIRADGTRRLLDATLPSINGLAWATSSKRTGFKRVVASVRRHKFGRRGHRKVCDPASVVVFPSPFPP
jgi:hypothetical protein